MECFDSMLELVLLNTRPLENDELDLDLESDRKSVSNVVDVGVEGMEVVTLDPLELRRLMLGGSLRSFVSFVSSSSSDAMDWPDCTDLLVRVRLNPMPVPSVPGSTPLRSTSRDPVVFLRNKMGGLGSICTIDGGKLVLSIVPSTLLSFSNTKSFICSVISRVEFLRETFGVECLEDVRLDRVDRDDLLDFSEADDVVLLNGIPSFEGVFPMLVKA